MNYFFIIWTKKRKSKIDTKKEEEEKAEEKRRLNESVFRAWLENKENQRRVELNKKKGDSQENSAVNQLNFFLCKNISNFTTNSHFLALWRSKSFLWRLVRKKKRTTSKREGISEKA